MRYLFALLMLASSSAFAVPVKYELTGYLTQVFPGGTAYDQHFFVGQTISGWYQVDWDLAGTPQIIAPGQPNQFAEIVNFATYALDVGGFRVAEGGVTSTLLRDRPAGSADTMTIWDVLPTATNHSIGSNLFDDIFITLGDPSGLGYGLTEATLDLDRFIVGQIAAIQGLPSLGFAGVGFDAAIVARQVPEPATLLLFLAGLGGMALVRRQQAAK